MDFLKKFLVFAFLAAPFAFQMSFANTAYTINLATARLITGTVMDENGAALTGVAVVVTNNTSIGTVTNEEGNFQLSVPDGTVSLTFSFIGKETQVVNIAGKNHLNIVMVEGKSSTLEEVVAVGYGVQKKQTMVGAVVQATEEDLKHVGNVPDLRQALSGQLPGIVSLTVSGEPGGILSGESATNIFIRGQNTWNGGQPLVLVDGVERDMNNIDVNDVASISVLKDASATAVFGVKGANGVILITSKRGRTGKPSLSLNYITTGQMVSKLPDKLDSYAALMAKNEIIEREGVLNQTSWNAYMPYEIVQRYRAPQSAEYAEIYPNVDWQKAMFDDFGGLSHKFSVSSRGGTEVVQYFGSLSYLHEGDMFKSYNNYKGYDPNYNFNRFNFRSNADVAITRTTKLKLDLSGYYSTKNTNYNNESSTARADQWMWGAVYFTAPDLFLPMYSDGLWGAYAEGANNTLNPVAVIYNLGLRQTRSTQLNFDIALNQKLDAITKGLSATGTFFYDNTVRSEGGIWDRVNNVRPNEGTTNVAYKQIYPLLYKGPNQDPSEYTVYYPFSDQEYDWVMNPWSLREEEIGDNNWAGYVPIFRRMMYQGQLNYNRKFGLHNVGALGLFKREEYARGSMFKNYREDWVFRTTYDYDSRYLLEANGAYNGSEQFGPSYRFDFFPSLAVGWNVSNEKFFKVKWIDNLKLRYSTGVVGDDNLGSGRWLYISQYDYGGSARLSTNTAGSSPYTFYRQSLVGNPNIHWEVAKKNNAGLDLQAFQKLLTLSVDVYNEDRTDILLQGTQRNVPIFFGARPPAANVGHVKSKGFEVDLQLRKDFTKDWDAWSRIALTHNENEIMFRDDAPLQYSYLKSAGYPIGQQRTMLRSGFYNNWDEVYGSIPMENNDLSKLPGYYDIVDFNADGIIKGTEDIVPKGYSMIPQNTLGVTLGTGYKGFTFMVQFYGVNNVNRVLPFNNYYANTNILYGHVADYWSKDNPNATSFLPRWQTQGEFIGDYYFYDASYVRLRTVELAYNTNKLRFAGLSNLRVFLNGNNLFFWSKLPDDREGYFTGGSALDGAYPTMKRIMLGLDLTF